MKRVTLSSGLELEVNEAQFASMEFVDAIAETESGNLLALSRVVSLLLPASEKRRLYDELREESGVVPMAAVTQAVTEIISAASKNS